MKFLGSTCLVFAAVCLSSLQAIGETAAPGVASDERVLFEKGRFTMNSKMKGGEVKTDPATRITSVIFTQPDGGMSARCILGPKRFDPLPYLGDPALFVDIVFRAPAGQPVPDAFYVVLQTLNMYVKPEIQKAVRSQTVPASAAENLDDGWKRIRIPFNKMTVVNAKDSPTADWTKRIRTGDGSPDITSEDLLERFQIFGTSKGAFELGKVSLVRVRNVSVEIRNDEADNTVKLEIHGRTETPDAEVAIKITDASGHAEIRQVKAVNGTYDYQWEKPPVTIGKSSTLQASVNGGNSAPDQSIPREVFGFLKDTSHVWLSVKGRDIVTSPLSKDGVQPFYSVGAGYVKSVLLRGYDEEVADYAKSMGLNTLRLAFYTLNFNGREEMPLTFDDITYFIDPVLTAAKRHQLYVILDDHNYFKNEINEETARGEQKSAGWTEEKFQRWVQRWVQVAERYKDEPYILAYELCNEPVCSPETAQKWYRKCIEAIRKVDQKHIIMVGSHHWSHARALEATWRDVANKIDEPYNNIVFSFHDYPQDDDPWKVQQYLRDFQTKYNVPIMCTEFGGGGKPERVHREAQAGMLALFAFDRIGWMTWAIYYDRTRAVGFPTVAVKNADGKTWDTKMENPGYYIPYVELWAPTARIMGSAFPEAAGN